MTNENSDLERAASSLSMLRAWLEIGDDRFPFSAVGEGRPLVLLHGLPGDLRTWEPHQLLLRDRFRCISYTQRWFGDLNWRHDGPAFGTGTHAADLIAFIKSLGLRQVSLVAWSYSVHVALQAMLVRPDLFNSAMLYEPGFATYLDDPSAQQDFWQDARDFLDPVVNALDAGMPAAAVKTLIDGSGGTGFFDTQPEPIRQIHLASASTLSLLIKGEEGTAQIRAEDLRKLAVPTTVCWGTQSRPLFRISSLAAANALPGSHREIEGCGHLWPEQDPTGFCELIADILAAQN